MVVSDFVPRVYLAATGKIATFTSGSPNWLKILALANLKLDDFIEEPNTDWANLYLPDYTIGTVTAAQSFTIPAAVRKISQQEGDTVRIVHTDGVTFTDYDIINYDRQKDYNNRTTTFQDNFVQEINGAIRFNRAFNSTDPQYGGTITAPCFGWPGPNPAPNYLINDTEKIPVPIPNWLVYSTAAQLNQTDVTRQNLVPNLNSQANQIMMKMKDNNKGQLTKIYTPWRPLGENWVDEAWSP